jgi:acyl carrier protein
MAGAAAGGSPDFNPAVADMLLAFIRDRFLPEGAKEELRLETPLAELSVLDPLNTARLLNYIRREMDTVIPPAMVGSENFRDVRSIATMISELGPSAPAR